MESAAPGNSRSFLTAQWRYLAMLNYEIDAAVLQNRVPQGTELDFFQGRTFISVVGFMFQDTRLLGLPVPCHTNFEEVNLRYYIRREHAGEVRRGVAFVKEIVPRLAISVVARNLYNENYVTHRMRHTLEQTSDGLHVCYQWRAGRRWNSINVQAAGQPQPAGDGSEEQFITEHYWGYVTQRDGSTMQYHVEHPPWNVWSDCRAELDCDVESLYGAEFVEPLSRPPSSAFLADGSAITVYRGQRIEIGSGSRDRKPTPPRRGGTSEGG